MTHSGVHRGDVPDVSHQAHDGGFAIDETESLSRTRCECKYHVAFIPVCRKKSVVRAMAAALGRSVPHVSRAEGERDRRGAVAARSRAHDRDPGQVCCVARDWVIKGKSAIHLVRGMGRGRGILWDAMSGHAGTLTTVGRDETVIGEYIRQQEAEDKRLDQINLWR